MPALPTTDELPTADQLHDHPLAAVRAGRPGAWDELYRRYHRLVLASACRRGATPDQAEDAAQTTWLHLVRNVDRIRDDRCLPAWLMVTAGNEACAVMRRHNRERPCAELDPADPAALVDEPDRVLSAVMMAGLRAPLRAAVLALPDRERRLVELLLSPEQLSYREISRRLEMPIGAIGPIRARALLHLRQRLSDLETTFLAA